MIPVTICWGEVKTPPLRRRVRLTRRWSSSPQQRSREGSEHLASGTSSSGDGRIKSHSCITARRNGSPTWSAGVRRLADTRRRNAGRSWSVGVVVAGVTTAHGRLDDLVEVADELDLVLHLVLLGVGRAGPDLHEHPVAWSTSLPFVRAGSRTPEVPWLAGRASLIGPFSGQSTPHGVLEAEIRAGACRVDAASELRCFAGIASDA